MFYFRKPPIACERTINYSNRTPGHVPLPLLPFLSLSTSFFSFLSFFHFLIFIYPGMGFSALAVARSWSSTMARAGRSRSATAPSGGTSRHCTCPSTVSFIHTAGRPCAGLLQKPPSGPSVPPAQGEILKKEKKKKKNEKKKGEKGKGEGRGEKKETPVDNF